MSNKYDLIITKICPMGISATLEITKLKPKKIFLIIDKDRNI